MVVAIGGTLWSYFQQGGPMMYALLLCSIVALIFIFERMITYYRVQGTTADIFSSVPPGVAGRGPSPLPGGLRVLYPTPSPAL